MPKRLHILYTIPNFDTAGSGKVIYDLASQLDAKRFKVSIVCNHDRGLFFKEVQALGLPIHLMPFTFSLRPYYSLLHRVQPFKKFLKAQKVDLVHSWHYSSDWTEPLACKLSGIPFVYTKKAMSWGNIHWKIRSYLSRFIITVNTDMAIFFPFKKKQQLIPFGLDAAHYSLAQITKPKESKKFKIIAVANLVPVKNIEVLIQAISALANYPIQLDILGDDKTPYAKKLKQLVTDLSLESKVLFLGKQLDVRPYLATANLYVISSKKEGMPMALVEAMTIGIPVLGSDISGINYVLKDFPELLFPASDIKELSTKIEALYHKPYEERLLLGNALRSYCVAHFSMEAFINAHERLYLKLTK